MNSQAPGTSPADHAVNAVETPAKAAAGPWRVGSHYNIHVYEGERPVATFHRWEDAQRCVEALAAHPVKPAKAAAGGVDVEAIWQVQAMVGVWDLPIPGTWRDVTKAEYGEAGNLGVPRRALSAHPVESEVADLRAEVERPVGFEVTLAQLRAEGWMVAVHNDYRLDGKNMTFWLFTRSDGRWIKGEGRTDDEALRQARAALSTLNADRAGDAGEAR